MVEILTTITLLPFPLIWAYKVFLIITERGNESTIRFVTDIKCTDPFVSIAQSLYGVIAVAPFTASIAYVIYQNHTLYDRAIASFILIGFWAIFVWIVIRTKKRREEQVFYDKLSGANDE